MRRWMLLATILFAWLAALGAAPPARAPQDATPTPRALTSAELISTINRIRTGRGLPALTVDPILMGTAQSTADIMAAYRMTGHIGDVRGRVMAAGYGAGDIPWATENFAVLPMEAGMSVILQIWSDELHMKPMADPNYKHIGAGVSIVSEEAVYYIVHAAYTSNRTYKPGATAVSGASAPGAPAVDPFSQYIFAVQTTTPHPDGSLIHVVKQGQSLWSIAIAYQTHINILQQMNGMASDNLTIYTGQKLRVPTPAKTQEIKVIAAATATAAHAAAAPPGGDANPQGPTATHPPTPTGMKEEVNEIASPTFLPPIPTTGDALEQSILTLLIVLGILGVVSIVFGVVMKR